MSVDISRCCIYLIVLHISVFLFLSYNYWQLTFTYSKSAKTQIITNNSLKSNL